MSKKYLYCSVVTKTNDILHGYIIENNDIFLLLANIEDFHLDGYIWIRKKHIKKIMNNKTDMFTAWLLHALGIQKNIKTHKKKDLWLANLLSSFLATPTLVWCLFSMDKENHLMIWQCVYIDESALWIRWFSVDGIFEKTVSRIPIRKIISMNRWGEYLMVLSKYIPLKTKTEIKQAFNDNSTTFYDLS